MYILEWNRSNNVVLPNMEQLYTLVDNIHETTGAIKEYHTKNNSSSRNLNNG
jgi:hypothetical protein